MNYLRPELMDRLAAEYVLGTLHGQARRRFERLMKEHSMVRTQVNRWQKNLDPLAFSLTPVKPPERVWRNISARLGIAQPPVRSAQGWWQSLNFWRYTSGFALAAVLLLTVGIVLDKTAPNPAAALQLVAVLNNSQTEPVLLAHFDAQRAQLHLTSVGQFNAPSDHDYELWALKDGKPQSLGVLNHTAERVVQLDIKHLDTLHGSQLLAVSLEPRGGSPSGAPTGPVLLTGKLRLS